MKRAFLVMLVMFIASLVLVKVARGEVVIGGDEIYGPWTCSTCSVSSPVPDASTRAYIDGWEQWQRDNVFFGWSFAPGDKIVVCNASHCATYVVTVTGYLGKKREPISPPSGSGGGHIGGGGGNPFNGCVTETVYTCTTSNGVITGCQTNTNILFGTC